jgi:hypothetical protein
MSKIFLGGTCAETTWRKELIEALHHSAQHHEVFNPQVFEWSDTDMTVENIQKDMLCGIHLYYLTSDSPSVYSVAEAVQSSNTKGIITYVHFETKGLDRQQQITMYALTNMLRGNGAYVTCDGGIPTVSRILKNIP